MQAAMRGCLLVQNLQLRSTATMEITLYTNFEAANCVILILRIFLVRISFLLVFLTFESYWMDIIAIII